MSRNFELLRQAQKFPEDKIENQLPAVAEPVIIRPPRPVDRRKPSEAFDWTRITGILVKHWRWSALFAFGVLFVTTVATLLMKPVYISQSRLEIDPPGAEVLSLGGGSPNEDAAEYLETQAKNLNSDQLALAVIRRLQLGPDLVTPNAAVTSAPVQALPADPAAAPTSNERENRTLAAFKNSLDIRRDTGSRIVTVAFASHDPKTAAAVTNTLVEMFIENTYKARHDAVLKSTEWLSKQLDDIRRRMEESNATLAEFQQKNGIAALTDTQNTFSDRFSELDKQLTQAQSDRIQLQSYLNRLSGNSDALPQVSSNPVVQNLTQKLAEVQAELSQSLAIYGKNHPNVKKLQNQADELRRQIETQRASILGDLKTSYAAAQARERMMQSEVKDTTKQLSLMARYNELKKEAQTNSDLYNNLFSKIKEAGIAAESRSTNVRVIDPARVMDTPARPRRAMNIALGLLAGMFGGITLAFVLEGLDRTVRTPEDIRSILGIRGVSVVPVIGRGDPGYGYGKRLLGRRATGSQKFLIDSPDSPEAEAMRGLQTSVRLYNPSRPPQVLLVLSPFPGDGKTTVASNLAIALSQHSRTCLVDADLRKSGIAEVFEIPNDRGLADLLAGNAQVEEIVVPVSGVPNLGVVPTGANSATPGQLIDSDQMAQTIRQLRTMYDHIVIDSPPILPFADGRALSILVDGVILVGRSGTTTRDAIARSIELLESVHSAPIIDVVLNAAEFGTTPIRYYRYGAHYKNAKAS